MSGERREEKPESSPADAGAETMERREEKDQKKQPPKSTPKVSEVERHAAATKIQALWRGYWTRKIVADRFNTMRQEDMEAEAEWARMEKRRIDIAEAQFVHNRSEVQNQEVVARHDIVQTERIDRLQFNAMVESMQNRVLSMYPLLIFQQHETMARSALVGNERNDFCQFVELQEIVARDWLLRSEAAITIRDRKMLASLWNEPISLVPNDEMKARALIMREEKEARDIRQSTHFSILRSMVNMDEMKQVEMEEKLKRAELKLDENKKFNVAKEEIKKLRKEAGIAQQARLVQEEMTAREELQGSALDFFFMSVEALCYLMRNDTQRDEEKARQPFEKMEEDDREFIQGRSALFAEEEEKREEISEDGITTALQQFSKFTSRKKDLQGALDVIGEEVVARVHIKMDEIKEWYKMLFAELQESESVSRQGIGAEQKPLLKALGKEVTNRTQNIALVESESKARAELEDEESNAWAKLQWQEDGDRKLIEGIQKTVDDEDLGRRGINKQEHVCWEDIQMARVEADEEMARGKLDEMEENDRLALALNECWQMEDCTRQELIGEEIHTRHATQVETRKQLEEAIKAYEEAMQVRHQEELSILMVEEQGDRQGIRSLQIQARKELAMAALEDKRAFYQKQEEREEWEANLKEEQKKERAAFCRDEDNKRHQIELEQIQDEELCLSRRALGVLEHSTRGLTIAEEDRKFGQILARSEWRFIEAIEAGKRREVAALEQKWWDECLEENVASKRTADLDMLRRRETETNMEELQDLVDFEAEARQRKLRQEHRDFEDLQKHNLEVMEQIQRRIVVYWEVTSRGHKEDLALEDMQDLTRISAQTKQYKLQMMQFESDARLKQEYTVTIDKRDREERNDLLRAEAAERLKIMDTEQETFILFPQEECIAAEQIQRRVVTRQQKAQASLMGVGLSLYAEAAMGIMRIAKAEKKTFIALMEDEEASRDTASAELEESEERPMIETQEAKDRVQLLERLEVCYDAFSEMDAVKIKEKQTWNTMAKAFGKRIMIQAFNDLDTLAETSRANIERFEEQDRSEMFLNHRLMLVDFQNMEHRAMIERRECEAFQTKFVPWLELQEKATRSVLAEEIQISLDTLHRDVRRSLRGQEQWMELRDLQLDENSERRKVAFDEESSRQQMILEHAEEIAEFEGRVRAAAALKKEQAMARLHFSLIERDTRHSIRHDAEKSFNHLEEECFRVMWELRALQEAAAKTEDEKARLRAQRDEELAKRDRQKMLKNEEWAAEVQRQQEEKEKRMADKAAAKEERARQRAQAKAERAQARAEAKEAKAAVKAAKKSATPPAEGEVWAKAAPEPIPGSSSAVLNSLEQEKLELESMVGTLQSREASPFPDELPDHDPLNQSTGSNGSGKGLVSKRRGEWGSTSPSPELVAAPQVIPQPERPPESQDVQARRSAAGTPSSVRPEELHKPLRNAAGSPMEGTGRDKGISKRVGIQPPINEPRQTVTKLESFYGQSPRSIYSWYCREYDVATKPQILAALPKKVGDFTIRELRIGGQSLDPTIGESDPSVVSVQACVPGNRGILPILEVVRACPNMRTLVLDGCGLQSTGVEWLVECLVDHPSMATLDLSGNTISSTGAQLLIYLADKNPRFTTIQLDDSHMTDRQVMDLRDAIQSNMNGSQRLAPLTPLN